MLYFLSVEQAGLFGSITLVINFFSVVSGFESHICLQRELVNKSNNEIQKIIKSALIFFCINYLITIPILALALFKFGVNGWILIISCFIIAVSEHICNMAYNLAIVHEEYIKAMPLIITKNIILISATIFMILNKYENTLSYILCLWAVISSVILLLFIRFIIVKQSMSGSPLFSMNLEAIKFLYRNTYINFLIGAVAVLSLQFDRLIVSLNMTESEVGVYFRHVSVISILYQLFNIISYNKLVPKIFSVAKHSNRVNLKKIINKEYNYILIISFLSIIALYFSVQYLFANYIAKFEIDIVILIVLLLNFTIRSYADFMSLIFNAFRFESRILFFQLTSLVIGVLVLYFLIPVYKINGVLMAIVSSTLLYSLLMILFCPQTMKTKNYQQVGIKN